MATQPLDVSIALLPDESSEVVAYTLKSELEQAAKAAGIEVDLTVKLFDSYDKVNDLGLFDVVEVDLCMRDKLADGAGQPNLDKIPSSALGGRAWLPPVEAAIQGPFKDYLVPHWIRMPFFIHWNDDVSLNGAATFDEICSTLDPSIGAAERFLFSDLWGEEPLGIAYADAMLDLRGDAATAAHLRALAASDNTPLDPEAVLKVWRISSEMRKEMLEFREQLHELPTAYARGFATNHGSALYGPLSMLGTVDLYAREEPWRKIQVPLPPTNIRFRQMPFAEQSSGTPFRATAFVVPKGKLAAKVAAITFLLDFLTLEKGYECFLTPKADFPGTYQIPAESGVVFSSSLVKNAMPLLLGLRTITDNPSGGPPLITYPLFDGAFVISTYDLHDGLRKAGNRLQPLLRPASV